MTPTLDVFSLKDQAAIVTGAAKGIGLAIATRLSEAGASVLMADIDASAGEASAKRLADRGLRVAFTRSDSGLASEGARLAAQCVKHFGRLDLLVNNAGIFPARPALDLDEATWDQVFAVNLKGAFFHAQAAARVMRDAGTRGCIINVASIDALHPAGGLTHYDASKAGMVMMTRALAKELGPLGIRVNTLSPGSIRTPGADAAMAPVAQASGMSAEAMRAAFNQRIPLGRTGEGDDIAWATVFLASPASSYITGVNLIIDGGYLVG